MHCKSTAQWDEWIMRRPKYHAEALRGIYNKLLALLKLINYTGRIRFDGSKMIYQCFGFRVERESLEICGIPMDVCLNVLTSKKLYLNSIAK